MSNPVIAQIRNGFFLLTVERDGNRVCHVLDGELKSTGEFKDYGTALKETKVLSKMEQAEKLTQEARELTGTPKKMNKTL